MEIDWLVGPIPIEDGIGKEIILKYDSDIANNGIYWTDANGRQFVKRVRNSRESYTLTDEDLQAEPVSLNYYPISTGITISGTDNDGITMQLSVFTDR